MCCELGLARVILSQRLRQRRDPITDLESEMRGRRAHHLRKLGRVGKRVVVLQDRHSRNLATAECAGDRS